MFFPRVTVVIPNWNGVRYLPGCLGALAVQSFTDFEIVLVDNASSDGSAQWVRAHHPSVHVLQRADNGGFSKAVNAWIQESRTEYVALLNNDTTVDADWLAALVETLDAHQSYDFAASRLMLADPAGYLNAAGDTYSLLRMTGRNRGFGKRPERYSRMERVLGACAAAALYRRRLFSEVGLFDEDFLLMSEDIDFDLRCLIAGKRCLYVPDAIVTHKLRASIDARPSREMNRLAARNEAIVAAKDLPGVLLPVLPVLMACRLVTRTILVRPSRWRMVPGLVWEAPSIAVAYVEGLRLGIRKRPTVWRLRTVSTLGILLWLVRGHTALPDEHPGLTRCAQT